MNSLNEELNNEKKQYLRINIEKEKAIESLNLSKNSEINKLNQQLIDVNEQNKNNTLLKKKFKNNRGMLSGDNIFNRKKVIEMKQNSLHMNNEVNDFSYKEAKKYDKRTFFQYYWSNLKQNQSHVPVCIPTLIFLEENL